VPPPTVPSAPQRTLPRETLAVPPTATFQLQALIILSEEYTDNFNLTESDKQSNFRTSLSPGFRLLINSPFTKGVVAYTFAPSYDTATEDTQFFHSLLGQVTWEATPLWRITLADALTRSDQASEADRLGLRQQRETFTSNTLSLSSEYLLGTIITRQFYRFSIFGDDDAEQTRSHTVGLNATVPLYVTNSLTGGYEYLNSSTDERNGDQPARFGDRRTSFGDDITGHRLNATFTRQVTTLRSMGLTSSYAFRTVSGQEDSDFQLWNTSVFMNHTLPGRLTLRGSVGVSGLHGESGSVGPNVSTATSLGYQFARLMLTLGFDRGFSETFTDGENFGVVETESVTGAVTYQFTPSLSAALNGFFRRNRFTDVSGESNGSDRFENWGGTLAVSWRIWRSLLFDLSYSYIKQNGQDSSDTNSYAENRVRAGVSLSF
jgi:hypothetical protein